jgi:hypothetical protein
MRLLKRSTLISDQHHIRSLVTDGDQILVSFGMIPIVQGRRVGEFYDDRAVVRMHAAKNGGSLCPKNDFCLEGD